MVNCIYYQVKKEIKNKISVVYFIAITCDDVTTMDNGSWICIHAYIVENNVKIPQFILTTFGGWS